MSGLLGNYGGGLLAAAPAPMRRWDVTPEPMIPPGVATMQAPSQAFPLDPVASRANPLAAFMQDRGFPMTQSAADRLTQQGVDAATNWAGTTPMRGIRAFHGSPHDFDRFDMSKIGTGEGAQAYGHGLYFAQSEDVARRYRDTLTNWNPSHVEAQLVRNGVSPEMANTYAQWAAQTNGGRSSADEFISLMGQPHPSSVISAFRQRMLAESDALKSAVSRINGRMYEVNLNVDPNRLLDWDAPLSQQPQAVREALGQVIQPSEIRRAPFNPEPTGGDVVQSLGYRGTGDMRAFERSPNASRALRDAGIPGIRYLDEGSRAAGDGTRNYVMFDDSLIEILRKYGIGGLGILGGGGAGLLGSETVQ